MAKYTDSQLSIARVIANTARPYGEQAVFICILVSLDESSLENVAYGDISAGTGKPSLSLGINQQVADWGSVADRMDPVKATLMLLHGGAKGQRGILDIPGWQTLPAWDVAQRVQESQYDGVTDWSKEGADYGVLPYAQNYKDNMAGAAEVVSLIGGQVLLTDLADVLRPHVKVYEMPGWKERGENDGPFNPIGILLHHDAMGLGIVNSNPNDDMNVPQNMAQNGISGSQIWIRYDGLVVIMAAGRKWHAGLGIGYGDIGRDQGNSLMIGIETDYPGTGPWPVALVEAIYRVSAALKQHYGFQTKNCAGHREYTRDTGRKPDPANFDLDLWRGKLSMDLSSPVVIVDGTGNPPVTAKPPVSNPTQEDDLSAQDVAELKAAIAALPAQVAKAVAASAQKPVIFLKVGGGIGEFNSDHFNPKWHGFSATSYKARCKELDLQGIKILMWPTAFQSAKEVELAGFGKQV